MAAAIAINASNVDVVKAQIPARRSRRTPPAAGGRGMLVDFRDSGQLADAINSLLDHPDQRQALESASYSYANDMTLDARGRAQGGVDERSRRSLPLGTRHHLRSATVSDLGGRLAVTPS